MVSFDSLSLGGLHVRPETTTHKQLKVFKYATVLDFLRKQLCTKRVEVFREEKCVAFRQEEIGEWIVDAQRDEKEVQFDLISGDFVCEFCAYKHCRNCALHRRARQGRLKRSGLLKQAF